MPGWTHESTGEEQFVGHGYPQQGAAGTPPYQQYTPPIYGDPNGGYGTAPGAYDYAAVQAHNQDPGAWHPGAVATAPAPYSMDAAAMLHDSAEQSHAYGFPTVGGRMQLLDDYARQVVGYRTRLRWENIVPSLAALAFALAAILFAKDFNQIMGREDSPPKASSSSSRAAGGLEAAESDATALTAGVVEAKLAEARELADAGSLGEAAAMLHQMLDAANASDFPQITRLSETINASRAQQESLALRLDGELHAKRWARAVHTLEALRAIAPLTDQQQLALANSKRGAGVDTALGRVQGLVNRGKLSAGLQAVTAAIATTPDPRLSKLKRRIEQRLSAVPTTTTPAAPAPIAANGGASSGAPPPNSTKPPSSAPAPPKGVPNPTGGGVTGGQPPAGTMSDAEMADMPGVNGVG